MLGFSIPASADVKGSARAIDGDTLEFSDQRVRLQGIDAPELNQKCWLEGSKWPCGKESSRALQNLIDGAVVRCQKIDRDRYGRIVARCHSNGHDIGHAMVASGMALAYRKYSSGYIDAEVAAKAKEVGIWKSKFIEPWLWRRGKRLFNQISHNKKNCKIKGNISRSGKRIYHAPGSTYYGRTRITESNGERWFCSEKEAKDAGWRKSRR
tara:strand:+ start:2887 stop:3516 length:630 start_codon:yes stop_codon:yes gene_type:complete